MKLTIEKLVEDLKLEVLVQGKKNKRINIKDVSRPGLQFAGYYDYFGYKRIQILGKAECSYLDILDKETRESRLDKFCKFNIPCIIIARDLEPHDELLKKAQENNIWLLRSPKVTTRLVNKIINYLDRQLAKNTSIHGVLMDVYGLGILITGESGIGKSETALELIKKGHTLISDDAVDIKVIDNILYGSSPYITYGMLEVRGMGIIDITRLYGLSSISHEKNIDFIINLQHWDKDAEYDRLGNNNATVKILGVPVKTINIPVRPGRNLSVIVEAAAVNFRYGLVSKDSPVDIIEKRIDIMNSNKYKK